MPDHIAITLATLGFALVLAGALLFTHLQWVHARRALMEEEARERCDDERSMASAKVEAEKERRRLNLAARLEWSRSVQKRVRSASQRRPAGNERPGLQQRSWRFPGPTRHRRTRTASNVEFRWQPLEKPIEELAFVHTNGAGNGDHVDDVHLALADFNLCKPAMMRLAQALLDLSLGQTLRFARFYDRFDRLPIFRRRDPFSHTARLPREEDLR